jgi:RNA 3'-terminal phosphate cyclase (ATP)
MATGKAFRIHSIRAGRKKPGMMRQHLTCVKAAARVCSAEMVGAELGSTSLTFRPGPMIPGRYSFAVGSAGSSILVFQTLMPALITTGQAFELVLEGGTHNPSAPPLDFIDRVYLAALGKMGVEASIKTERRGFFPDGGGKWTITVNASSSLMPLVILERGNALERTARMLWNRIPPQEAQRARAHLSANLGWEQREILTEEAVDAPGTGNVIMAELRYEHITEMLTAFNPFGASAEAMCDGLMADVRRYCGQAAPVGRRLADQLLVPMALGSGGVFRTMDLSSHCITNIATIGLFSDRKIDAIVLENGMVEVRVGQGKG